jgi:RNA polymerase sigma-70 factor (ECF subfamily)
MTAPASAEFPIADESLLVSRAIENDRAAQDALYDGHAARVYRLAFRMCNDADLASDLTQETFIRAFAGLRSFRHDAALSSWIHRIALSVILSALRTRKRRDAHRVPLEMAGGVGQMDVHTDIPLRERLHAAIDALPDGYRTVFVMYEIEGYTHPEIARALGVTVSTSQGQLFRARAKLRESLSGLAGETRS